MKKFFIGVALILVGCASGNCKQNTLTPIRRFEKKDGAINVFRKN